ncbi:hypothetical protein [Leisingera caerulea]|uniref:hypothetical protein n=1 Tax=Leisingera caerulea TaxID=506591 RepID=UPI0021A57BD3|nr:hypothetical protein [Leisingera caerulea]UWQ84655.1 hypothetical protein K3726_05480 [Leisingera caerulea]
MKLLIVAIFLEIALTTVFYTRLWREKFEQLSGAKTLVAIILSGILVCTFDLNVFLEMMAVVQEETYDTKAQSWISYLVTTLIVAGGSGTVYQLYVRLRIRVPALGGGENSGVALTGTGSLTINFTRRDVVKNTSVAVTLNDEFVGNIVSDEPTLALDSVNAGSYVLALTGHNMTGKVVTAKRVVGIEPDKATVAIVEL